MAPVPAEVPPAAEPPAPEAPPAAEHPAPEVPVAPPRYRGPNRVSADDEDNSWTLVKCQNCSEISGRYKYDPSPGGRDAASWKVTHWIRCYWLYIDIQYVSDQDVTFFLCFFWLMGGRSAGEILKRKHKQLIGNM